MTGAALRQFVLPAEGEARGARGSRIHPKRKQGAGLAWVGGWVAFPWMYLSGWRFLFFYSVGSCSEAGVYLQIKLFL